MAIKITRIQLYDHNFNMWRLDKDHSAQNKMAIPIMYI